VLHLRHHDWHGLLDPPEAVQRAFLRLRRELLPLLVLVLVLVVMLPLLLLLLLLLLLAWRYARFGRGVFALRLVEALYGGGCDCERRQRERAHLDKEGPGGRRTVDGFGIGAVVAVAFTRAGVEV
jgi:hypothetical protein